MVTMFTSFNVTVGESLTYTSQIVPQTATLQSADMYIMVAFSLFDPTLDTRKLLCEVCTV